MQPECQGYAKPGFQSGASLTGGTAVYGQPSDGVRDIPDVSMFASNGEWGHFQTVCWNDPLPTLRTRDSRPVCTGAPGAWSGFGRTQVASPTLAGIQALVNQKTGQNWGIGALTNYYQMGQNEYGSAGGTFSGASCNASGAGGPATATGFNDVTQGDIAQGLSGQLQLRSVLRLEYRQPHELGRHQHRRGYRRHGDLGRQRLHHGAYFLRHRRTE